MQERDDGSTCSVCHGRASQSCGVWEDENSVSYARVNGVGIAIVKSAKRFTCMIGKLNVRFPLIGCVLLLGNYSCFISIVFVVLSSVLLLTE